MAVSTYQNEQHALPPDWATLVRSCPLDDQLHCQTVVRDGWDRPIELRLAADHHGFTLISCGADGLPGGEGNDLDLWITADGELSPPPPFTWAGWWAAKGSVIGVVFSGLAGLFVTSMVWLGTAQPKGFVSLIATLVLMACLSSIAIGMAAVIAGALAVKLH